MAIKEKVESLMAQIKMLNMELEGLQESCEHPWPTRKFVGGYDSRSDTYWRDNFCTICEKRWTETSK